MKITFAQNKKDADILVVPIFEDKTLPKGAPVLLEKYIAKTLRKENTFQGKKGQTLSLYGIGSIKKVILLGLGDKKDSLDETSARQLGSTLFRAIKRDSAKQISIHVDGLDKHAAKAEILAAHLADSLLLESYEFKKYKTGADATSANPGEITFVTASPDKTEKKFDLLRKVTESVFWASDLANEPGNVLNPQTYAERIEKELVPLGIKITVISQQEMKQLGMGAALAVGQGSSTPPCMVVMEYDGSDGKQKQPLALVGKGITFDSGGISIKPGAGMGDMTLDMGGSAAVVGTMRALASRKSASKVVAIVGLAENMPDGKSYRPGDILKSMNGKTIYVGNTDAEGRLVLADALTYIQRTYNPHTVIDLATLTGAAKAALGNEFAAVFANDDSLCGKFNKASAASGEKIWRLPLTETNSFQEAVRATPLADLTNLASGPGASTAAAFLREFIEKDENGRDKCQWMHIDMAGPGIPFGLRKGWGVLLLNQLVRDHYEVNDNAPAAKPKPAAVRRKP